MYVSLFVLGIIAAAAGVVMVGFGISINEFSLGNTLLITGTTAIIGGLILIGLAMAVKQLRRIAEALMARPVPGAARPFDALEPPPPGNSRRGSGPGRIPFPSKPNAEGPGGESREPHLAAAPSIDTSKNGFFDQPRSPFPSMTDAPEPRIGSDRHENPLPLRADRSSEPDSQLDFTEVVAEVRSTDMAAGPVGSMATEMLPVSRLDVLSRPAPPSDTAGQSELFDALWPADVRPSKAPILEAELRTEISESMRSKEEGWTKEQKTDEAPAEPHAVSILKSGVIDEMAYTLYSDGSIEAELPQGTMRFASIAELRGYLEKSS
jgi:hypothetical protein